MRIRPSGASKIRGAGRRGTGISPIEAGQPGAGSTRLPDNSYVLNADLEALKQSWPEGYKVLTEQGYTAYSQMVSSAKTASVDIKAKYDAIKGEKMPVSSYGITSPYQEYFPKYKAYEFVSDITSALQKGKITDIPMAPGYYQYSDKKSSINDKTKDTTSRKTTYVYARLEDGSLVQVDKQTVTKTHPAYWLNKMNYGVVGAKTHIRADSGVSKPEGKGWYLATSSEFSDWVNRSIGGLTHEQKLGASKLAPELAAKEGKDYEGLSSNEKKGLYQQALGLVSASGYYDLDAIVQVGPHFESPYGPAYSGITSTGRPIYGTYTPEVAGAIKKLKPFEKKDGTYDWSAIVSTKDTQVAIAATKIAGMDMAGFKGIKTSIDTYPELGKALSERGWEGYQTEADKIKKEWEAELKKDSPGLYAVYVEQGYPGLEKSIEAANARYEAHQARVKSGELILLPDGQYIEKTDMDNQSEGTQQILKEEGFKGYEALLEPDWEHGETHEVITQTQFQQMVKDFEAAKMKLAKQGLGPGAAEWDKLGDHPTSIWTLTPESTQRDVIKLAAFIAPAARAGLKEYTIKDISAIEWGLTAVNTILLASAFAPGAIIGSLAGRAAVAGISASGTGMIGYMTARDWADLTITQRAIGIGGAVLYSLPLLITAARGVRVTTSPGIPTAEGVVPTWRGLTIAKNPIIGRSGGRWVIGAREITLPEARLILDGYHPEGMLETKVFVNAPALARAKWSQTQIKYLIDTLKTRNLFAGKKSAFVSGETLLEPTKYIDADEMALWLQQIAKYNKKITSVDMLYGGTAIRAELAPAYRGWRQLHDLDMRTTFDLAGSQKFVNETFALLKKLPGKRQYRISPKSPVRIEKLVDGKWEHMNDLKSEFIDPSLQISDIAASKLDSTGAYSYGRMVAEPTITVKVPGVGKFDIMAISEAGVRKSDTILRVRQTLQGTAFRPPQRGIARPGVPKDAADFYVILKTFEESLVLKAGTADEWLESWARAMGHPKADITKMLPNLKKAALRVASESPSNIIGYRFTPSSTTSVSPGASPSIMIHVPSSLGASVSGSLASRISRPVSPYSLSPKVRGSASAAVYTLLSKLKGGVAPSAALSTISPKLRPSPKAPPSPRALPSPSPSPSPALKVSPAPAPSPKAGVRPGLVPVVPVGVGPSPAPKPVPKPKPKPAIPVSAASTRGKERDYKGAEAWQQGYLKRGKELVGIVKVWVPPFRQEDLETYWADRLPPDVKISKGKPEETIQLIRGTKPSPEAKTADIGAFLVTTKAPMPSPGRAGAITFKKDVKGIRGTSKEALAKLPLGTTLSQLVEGNYNSKIPRNTVDMILTTKLGDSSSKEIAEVLKSLEAEPSTGAIVALSGGAEVPVAMGYTKEEVLKRLPDSKRREVERLLTETAIYAPTRGYPKFAVVKSKLSRKKKKTKSDSREETIPSISATR